MSSELTRHFWRVVDDFWMRPCDLRMLDILRRGYGILLIVWVGWMWIDRHLFFGEGSWLPPEAAKQVLDQDAWSLYSLTSGSPTSVNAALLLLGCGGLALTVGFFPRVAAAVSFFLLVAIQHANNLLVDAEDVVFKLFAFYLIFVPPWRQMQLLPNTSGGEPVSRYPAWPLRLFQLQMCIIYLCSAIQKTDGAEWLDGTAMYYVLRLDDAMKFPLPAFISESLTVMKVLTWAVLVFELLAPFLIWLKSTRWICLITAASFHLATHYSLNLHLFHLIMLVGLLSFVRYDEWQAWCRRCGVLGATLSRESS